MSESASSSFNHKLDCPNSSVVLSIKSGASNFTFDSVYNYFIFTTSIDGYYSLFREPALSGFYLDGEQNRFSLDSLRSSFYPQISGCVFYSAGKKFSPYLWYSPPNSSTKFSYFFISVIPPVYKVEPFDPESGTVGESYTPDTRPTVITGDYGIVDNQGVATVIKDCTIVNETTNNYYNPDTGQLVQEGYTIYECTRCGEQNRTTSGAGPPPSGGGDAPGGEEDASIWDKLGDLLGTLITGISGLLGSVLGKLLEALTSLSQLILGGLGTVVETVLSLFDSVPRLFGGFLAFLSAVFPFLPEEMVTLLTFGLAAVVFIGILKAVRK